MGLLFYTWNDDCVLCCESDSDVEVFGNDHNMFQFNKNGMANASIEHNAKYFFHHFNLKEEGI